MASEQARNPQERVAITMTVEDWHKVRRELDDSRSRYVCKMYEWLANCPNKKMGQDVAGNHRRAAEEAERLYKIIEAALYPAQPETE